jgi:diguanylate cyclase (GGDEF)-like protein/PAS domain S-box-containing protein
VLIEKNADLADTACGMRSNGDAGQRKADLGVAIDVFQRLAGAPTALALFDAILAAALDYTEGSRACIFARDGSERQISVPVGADNTMLAEIVDIAMASPCASGGPNVIEYDSHIGIVMSLDAHGCLCVVQTARPSQTSLDILTLIAACGTTLFAKLTAQKTRAESRQSLSRHLVEERGLLRTLIDNMPDQIYVKDTEGRFVLGNTATAECIGVASPQDLIGKSDLEFFPGECGLRFHRDEQTLMKSGQAIVDQLEENINQAGVRRWYSTTKVPYQDEHGNVIGVLGMSRDVSLRVAADEAIRLRNRAIESSQDAIVITSCLLQGNPVVYVNPAFERITGFSFDEAIEGGVGRLFVHDEQAAPPELLLAMREHCEGRAVLQSHRKDDTVFWNEVRVAPVCDIAGRATHFVFTMSDITKARDSEEKLERMASHDALTGLPNRRMLMDRLSQAVALGERGNYVVAVAFIDLDRLKFVNDNFGHEAGDVLLKTVADRMAACVRKSDTVARLGGDEFVIVSLHSTTHASMLAYPHIKEMLQKIQGVLAEPIEFGGEAFSVTCSIGVSVFPQHGDDADNLLKNADAAMYLAKKNGRNSIVFYAGEGTAALTGGGPSSNGL